MVSPHPVFLGVGRRTRVISDLSSLHASSVIPAPALDVLRYPEPHTKPDYSLSTPFLRHLLDAPIFYPLQEHVFTTSLTLWFAPTRRFDLMKHISLRAYLLRQGFVTNRGAFLIELSLLSLVESCTTLMPEQDI